MAVIYAIIAFSVINDQPNESKTYDARDTIAALGVTDGKSYDVLLGGTTAVGQGNSELSVNSTGLLFFGTSVSVNQETNSSFDPAVQLGFKDEFGKYYVFVIPFSQMVFLPNVASADDESIVFRINPDVDFLSGTDAAYWVDKGNGLLFGAGRVKSTLDVRNTAAYKDATTKSLADILPQALLRVEISLTREHFKNYVMS